ncbi:MAG: NADH-quinone oxidoreductase subunit J [Chloroflexi bacterium]|nr:NADH-quinone oxidoreductase subunit J [Chloroflexota bacterium]
MGVSIAFWIFATMAVAAALAVIAVRNIFRAALSLIILFGAVAALFFTLSADFLAVAQLLVYAGAIAILILFAIVVTPNFQFANRSNKLWLPTLVAAALVLAAILVGIFRTAWRTTTPADLPTTGDIALALFDQRLGFVLPFEVASVLLLAAIIGAIAIVREK